MIANVTCLLERRSSLRYARWVYTISFEEGESFYPEELTVFATITGSKRKHFIAFSNDNGRYAYEYTMIIRLTANAKRTKKNIEMSSTPR